jgi:hypothetical protein
VQGTKIGTDRFVSVRFQSELLAIVTMVPEVHQGTRTEQTNDKPHRFGAVDYKCRTIGAQLEG